MWSFSKAKRKSKKSGNCCKTTIPATFSTFITKACFEQSGNSSAVSCESSHISGPAVVISDSQGKLHQAGPAGHVETSFKIKTLTHISLQIN